MAIPTELSDVLAGPLKGVTRIVVRHERRSRFRWVSLIELALFVFFSVLVIVCILPVLFVLALVYGYAGDIVEAGVEEGGFPLPSFKMRFHHYWHELVINCLDEQGNAVNALVHKPASAAEGHAVLGTVLAAADRAGIVVVETFGGAVSETFDVYFGGQPLMAYPELRTFDEAIGELKRVGFTVERNEHETRILHRKFPANRVGAGFLFAFKLLLLPFAFWSSNFREDLRQTYQDLCGVDPMAAVVTLHVDRRIRVHTERDGRVLSEHTVDARDLLAITYAASLGYDRDVKRRAPCLQLIERREIYRVPLYRRMPSSTMHAYRDFLLLLAIEQWEGIPSTLTRPTRCPYCGNLYVFAAEQSCPSCGASPGALA